MLKPRHAKILAAAMAVGIVFGSSVPSSAQKVFLDKIRRKYEMTQVNGRCELCHEKKPNEEPSRKNLNIFGKKVQEDPDMKPLLGKDEKYQFTPAELAIVEKIIAKLENDDTDKDGASNLEEFQLGTFAGDPKSVPDKKALADWRKKNPDKAFKGAAAAAPGKEAMKK